MKPDLPDPSQVLGAIETYIAIAYDGAPPTTVRSQILTLKSWGGPFFAAPVFAATGDPSAPRRTLRLGNRHYPHMKLAMEPSPDGAKYLFKADTHDRHICPAESSAEYAPFKKLMQDNQQIAERIEAAWAKQGIATFKTFLQEDLARRQQAQGKSNA
jgi:hypothetical protein